MSCAEIAKLSFSSRNTIFILLKHYVIPFNRSTNRRNNGAHVYGYKRFRGVDIKMKKEQEVISLIKLHKDNGYSYQRVADILNNQKLKTKQNKGIWYAKVVRDKYLQFEKMATTCGN